MDEAAAAAHTRDLLEDLLPDDEARDFAVRLWDGSALEPDPGRAARLTIVLAHPGALKAMLVPPTELTLGEAFVHGDFDVEGDLQGVFGLADRLFARERGVLERARLATRLLALPVPQRERAAAPRGGPPRGGGAPRGPPAPPAPARGRPPRGPPRPRLRIRTARSTRPSATARPSRTTTTAPRSSSPRFSTAASSTPARTSRTPETTSTRRRSASSTFSAGSSVCVPASACSTSAVGSARSRCTRRRATAPTCSGSR